MGVERAPVCGDQALERLAIHAETRLAALPDPPFSRVVEFDIETARESNFSEWNRPFPAMRHAGPDHAASEATALRRAEMDAERR
jgi:hypothetical protein